MSLARIAKRRDANERPIIDALEAAGCLVWQLDRPADLLVFVRNRFMLLEVKDGKKPPSQRRLTDEELRNHAILPTGAIPIVENVDQALETVRVKR